MRSLVLQKAMAVRLRRAGYTYREILQKVPASKSSLSLWLRDLPLSEAEQAQLARRRAGEAARGRARGIDAIRKRRVDRDAALYEEAKKTYREHRHDPFFLAGVALYWARGAARGSFSFASTDAKQVAFMMGWMAAFLPARKKGTMSRPGRLGIKASREALKKCLWWRDMMLATYQKRL